MMANHVIQSIENFLRGSGISFETQSNNDSFLFNISMSGKHGHYRLFLRVIPENAQVIFIGQIPVNVPADRHQEVILLLNKINQNISHGNFELDPLYGALSYRFSFCFDSDVPVSEKMIGLNFSICNLLIDSKLPIILQAVYATNSSPLIQNLTAFLPFSLN